MIEWRNIEEYENKSEGMIGDEPEVLLWNERTGTVIGRAWEYRDGDILTAVNGYHGFKFTKFAEINLPG